MKMLTALPRLLLLPLLCWAAPGHAQAVVSFESMLPGADTSPSLTVLASQSAGMAPAGRTGIFPLHLIGPEMQEHRAAGQQPIGAASNGAPQAAAASPPTPRVLSGGTILNFDGIASDGTAAPPDTNGAVGDTQFVQWVNTRMAIYRKSDGVRLLGPIPGNTVFAGMTGSAGADACRLSNNGDPIVLYDKLAKRWLLTQFAWAPGTTTTGPYFQCIALSTTSDATGTYYRYVLDVRTPANAIVFNDYPKVGVWPDAYYFTFVLFQNAVGGYLGPRACGFDRAAMLAGAAATVRCSDFGTDFGVILPSDLDGTTAPPAGSPNYLLSIDFNGLAMGDHLFLWRFSFMNNTISQPISVPVAPFTIACPTTFGGPCIRQPAPGELLDSLGDRLMHRLAYRNFGNREVLVANHSVQQPGAAADGPVGVRWYEIRDPAGTPAVYQQGTWAPDTNSRWMGSIAMDKMGNLALGYSVAGTATFAGVRYSGRLRSEPLGRLQAEDLIVAGSGVQTGTSNRWGDYSAMTIDPAVDCTFWYTQQYIAVTGSFNWRTRIADFRFRNCK